jgi:hypothetical protein
MQFAYQYPERVERLRERHVVDERREPLVQRGLGAVRGERRREARRAADAAALAPSAEPDAGGPAASEAVAPEREKG